MKTSKIIIALACGLLAGSYAQAQPAGMDGDGPPPGMPVIPIIAALDTNTNGIIDASEIANAPKALLKADKNGDGKLSAAELKPELPSGFTPPEGMKIPTLPIMVALDTNGDGELDAGEIANVSAALKTLDANHDGQLTRDEILPKFPGGPPPDDK
jgi:Ca2+-binding EF-hand superfamily protein